MWAENLHLKPMTWVSLRVGLTVSLTLLRKINDEKIEFSEEKN